MEKRFIETVYVKDEGNKKVILPFSINDYEEDKKEEEEKEKEKEKVEDVYYKLI